MDMTEFKVMEKNRELLERALEREEKQNDRISELEQEKIEILKANEKTITVIKKTEIVEHVLTKRNPYEVWKRIEQSFKDNRQRANFSECFMYDLDYIQDKFFSISKSHSMIPDEVTVKGLDEAKKEIKEDLESKITKETQDKFDRLEALELDHKKVRGEFKDADYEHDLLDRKFETLSNKYEMLILYKNNLEEKFSIIRDLFKENYGTINHFNAFNKLKKLQREVIKSKILISDEGTINKT